MRRLTNTIYGHSRSGPYVETRYVVSVRGTYPKEFIATNPRGSARITFGLADKARQFSTRKAADSAALKAERQNADAKYSVAIWRV